MAMSIPHWKIGRTIGRGATATVSLATNPNSGDLFAVKSSPIARSSLLQKEHKILSSLSSPYIISCLGSDTSFQSYNMFLELAEGGAISDIAGLLDERKIRSFTRQILLGLSHLHSKGIVHGDVKGRNVLLCSGGRVKLADFGCARYVDDGDRTVMGTPAFMAPELLRGFAGDVWSLGCTVVEMATGKDSDMVAVIRRILLSKDVPAMPGWVSEEGRDFLSKCLRRETEERWTVAQLLRHPFVLEAEEICSGLKEVNWVSPKSTMEFGLWELEVEEEEDDLAASSENLIERFWRHDSPPANWVWDDRWIEIRGRCDGGEENEKPECSSFVR